MLVYRCGRCGEVLYVYPSGEKRMLTPLEVAAMHNYACPHCGSRITGLMNPDWREHVKIIQRPVSRSEVQ